jgi:hypothetical protein
MRKRDDVVVIRVGGTVVLKEKGVLNRIGRMRRRFGMSCVKDGRMRVIVMWQ